MEELKLVTELTSIDSVKGKRKFRRKKITQIKTRIDELLLLPFLNLNEDKISELRSDFQREITIHSHLQMRYETLLEDQGASEEGLEEEMSTAEEQREQHRAYLLKLDRLETKLSHYVEASLIEKDYSELLNLDPSTKIYEKNSTKFSSRVSSYISKTFKYRDDEEISPLRESVQGLLSRINKTLCEHQVAALEKETPAPGKKEMSTTPMINAKPRFELDLPKFMGSPIEWHSFYKLFSTTIEQHGKYLTKEEKLCLLLKSMKDEGARKIVQLHSQSDDGYDNAIKALINNYGRPSVIYPHHVRKILQTDSYGYDRESFTRIRQRFLLAYESMETMKANTLSQFLAAVAQEDFNDKLREEWTKHIASFKQLPTLKELIEFLEPLEYSMPFISTNSTFSAEKSISKKQNNSKPSSKSKPVHKIQCKLCQESHGLQRCPIFLGYDVNKRNKYIRELKWCVNCLHPSHTCSNCSSSFTCRHCRKKHHSLLHRDEVEQAQSMNSLVIAKEQKSPSSLSNNTPTSTSTTDTALATLNSSINMSPNPNSSAAVEPPTIAFLNTAVVSISNGPRQRQARIALDTGASSSLITESLASHLKLKRYPQRLLIEGAYGGGTSRNYVQAKLQSIVDPNQSVTLRLSVISKLPTAYPPLRKEDIATDPHIKDLQLADPSFGGPLDVLVGSLDCCKCILGSFRYHTTPDIAVSPTIFGWTVTGPLDYQPPTQVLKIQLREDPLQQALLQMWELDKTPETQTQLKPEDETAVHHFQDTFQRESDGRYKVKLPKVDNPPVLGESRHSAVKRFLQNERSLQKKNELQNFNKALQEYVTLQHAEKVPSSELLYPKAYYLPVHGVFKETSTTTKLRPVFDASAKSTSGVALNDLLLTGPNLYPLLTDILIRFRTHTIDFSADISKMFWEVLLHEDDRDLHRFLIRGTDGQIQDHRMKRLTFGVKPSPFLATKVIQHLAESHSGTHPLASRAILQDFYVDDYLAGASTMEEAIAIRKQLCDLLNLAGMKLRKWRTSSDEFRMTIPNELVETEDLHLSASSQAPKALGIHWNVTMDQLHISIPTPSTNSKVTKRLIASESAKVFDVLGFFAPSTILPKILLQNLWQRQISWDETVPDSILQQWKDWILDLPHINNHSISRRYTLNLSPAILTSLHGFSDASNKAYGAVIYLRQVHEDATISVSLVMAKARVAPLKPITTPRAELVAAYLLSKLLKYTANLLNISQSQTYAWTDSSIVLCWLRKLPSTLKTFVAHRVSAIQEALPASNWRHVHTKDNPADLLSRGISAKLLSTQDLWWHGPTWLALPPQDWPTHQLTPPTSLPETRVIIHLTSLSPSSPPELTLYKHYSSFEHLTRILSWIRRFINNSRKTFNERTLSKSVTSSEVTETKKFLLRLSQQQTYPEVLQNHSKGKTLSKGHSLSRFRIIIDSDGLIKVCGRLRDAKSPREPKKLIPLSLQSSIVKLLVSTLHRTYLHPGTSTLMSIIRDKYHIPGLRNYLKGLSRHCVTCQKAYSKPLHQQMGLLPEARTTPAPPFDQTGVDFAGPFIIRQGHTRKPVLIKTYACLFVCLTTRAIHIELCADLTTTEYLAAFRRFCARRGTPSDVFSDNGTNFQGAHNELQELRRLTTSEESEQAISHLCTSNSFQWHFIPARTPHFGGLWEAGVKSMKTLLRKLISPHPLRFHELSTLLTEVESILNSRPLTPVNSTSSEDPILTPGHFLIGRPLRSPPTPQASQANISHLRRWALVQRLTQDLWIEWKSTYLQSLNERSKWLHQTHNFKVGEIVYLKDDSIRGRDWPLARITKTYPGDDGLVRVVDINYQGKTYTRSTHHLILLPTEDYGESAPPPQDVQDTGTST